MNENDAPPVEPGKIRVYEDHTGRWYRDVTPEEYKRLYNSEEMGILAKELQAEIDREMIAKMLEITEVYKERKQDEALLGYIGYEFWGEPRINCPYIPDVKSTKNDEIYEKIKIQNLE